MNSKFVAAAAIFQSRSPCIIPMASPARHRETAGKIQLPAVQDWGAVQFDLGSAETESASSIDFFWTGAVTGDRGLE